MAKIRILFDSEWSKLSSGFAKYYLEVIKRLHATGKYEIAEFASYATTDSITNNPQPWKIYPNAVEPNDPRWEQYRSNPEFAWGSWRFDMVCLHFRPDVVVSIKDPWMFKHHEKSPLRKFFHRVIMPTVDSEPQQSEWLTDFNLADAIFCYNDWGRAALEEAGLNVAGVAPPATDPTIYKPIPKQQARQALGINPELIIIGNIMRNQKRKLFPDMFETLRIMLDRAPQHLADRLFLYMHTSYPDRMGWDFPTLLTKFNIAHKVFFTYKCKKCRRIFVALFRGAHTQCPHCNQFAANMSHVGDGATEEELIHIFNSFDVYVQMAIAAGHEMPIPEAASCGVYPFAMDTCAMVDVVRKCGGSPLPIAKNFHEMETGAYRSFPDNDKSADLILDFLKLPSEVRNKMGFEARETYMSNYHWDETAKVWEEYFDSLELTSQWDSPPEFKHTLNCHPDMPHSIIIQECLKSLGKDTHVSKYEYQNILHMFECGIPVGDGVYKPLTKAEFIQKCAQQLQIKNNLEGIRCGFTQLPEEDYLNA